MRKKLSTAKSVLVIGDNVGEHIFDYLFIETLKELYPDVEYSYMVRGNPIINDGNHSAPNHNRNIRFFN